MGRPSIPLAAKLDIHARAAINKAAREAKRARTPEQIEKRRAYKKEYDARRNQLKTRVAHKRNVVPDYIISSARGRARKRGLPHDIKASDIEVPTHCPVLGIPLKAWGANKQLQADSPTLDRIIPHLGYVKGNVRVISWRANKIKSDATLEELERIVTYLRGHSQDFS